MMTKKMVALGCLMAIVGVLALVVAAPVSAAGRFEFFGSVGSWLMYTPEDLLEANVNFGLTGTIAGSPNLTLHLGWQSQSKMMWEDYDAWTIRPRELWLQTKGPLYQGGPSFTTTLGYSMLGTYGYPDYMAKHDDADIASFKGIAVSDLWLGESTQVTGVFGWPEWSSSKYSYVMGGVVKSQIGNVSLKAFALEKQYRESDVPKVTAADGAEHSIDHINGARQENEMVLYTPGNDTANMWGTHVFIKGGIVTRIIGLGDSAGQFPAVPEGGYILSGHGTASDWLVAHVHEGDHIALALEITSIPPVKTSDRTLSVEATVPVGASGDLALTVANHTTRQEGEKPQSHMAYRAGLTYDLTPPEAMLSALDICTLSLGYMRVDSKFEPYAREKDADKNPFEKARGCAVYTAGLSTTLAPDAKYPVAFAVNTRMSQKPEEPTDTVTELSASTSIGTSIGAVNLDGSITLPSSGENTYKAGASITTDLGPFVGVTLKGGYTRKSDATSGTTTLGFSYTAPNGLALAGQMAMPDDKFSTEDTFIKLVYSLKL